MGLYLTFDIGTTALKTSLVSDDGSVVGGHVHEYTYETPQPGRAEMAPETYWQAAILGAKELFDQTGADPSSVIAIGFSSQGQSFVPVDRNGEALCKAILWPDQRARHIADAWESDWMPRDEYRRTTGYPWLPAELTAFKVAWLAEQKSNAHRAWKFLCLPDYLIFRMTGETVIDRVMAQFTGFFNIGQNGWDSRIVAAAGISTDQLPRLVGSGEVAGTLSKAAADCLGIRPDIPVCAGANDQLCGADGAGNVRSEIVSETTGSVMAVVATTPELLNDENLFVGPHAVGGMHYAMALTMSSGLVLKWFRDLFAPEQDYDTFLVDAASVSVGSDGLTVLPHFHGTGTPTFNPSARGAFIGLTPAHSRAHIVRAILESCCCQLAECMDAIGLSGSRVETVRSLGGGARSDLWLQMKADMLGRPVERPKYAEAASLGAAMLAAVGTGQFRTVQDAAEAWYTPGRRFEPRDNASTQYREVYQRYKNAYDQLYGGRQS